jgi:hypothetical protein
VPAGARPTRAHDEATDFAVAPPTTAATSTSVDAAIAAPPHPACFRTALGGAFLLVNVAAALRLPRLAGPHFGLRADVGAWGWVELLARALLGARVIAYRDDPLWPALAALDGRAPGDPIGAGATGARRLRLPPEWPDADATRAVPVRLPGVRVARPVRRVLALALPHARRRLAAALPLDEPDAERAVERAVLRRDAVVAVASSHVDVTMRLADATLPVRLAGLDADPKWQPDFGRVILFHYAGALPDWSGA